MLKQSPRTEIISVGAARRAWSRLLSAVCRGEKRVIVEKSGVPVAAIISVDDLARFDEYERRRREGWEAIREIGEAFKDIPAEEIEREAVNAVREVRQERRAQSDERAAG